MQYTLLFLAHTHIDKQKTDKKANSRFAIIMLCSSNKLFSVSLSQTLLHRSFHIFYHWNWSLFQNSGKTEPSQSVKRLMLYLPSLFDEKIIPSIIYITTITTHKPYKRAKLCIKKLFFLKNVQCGHCYKIPLRKRKNAKKLHHHP